MMGYLKTSGARNNLASLRCVCQVRKGRGGAGKWRLAEFRFIATPSSLIIFKTVVAPQRRAAQKTMRVRLSLLLFCMATLVVCYGATDSDEMLGEEDNSPTSPAAKAPAKAPMSGTNATKVWRLPLTLLVLVACCF